MMELIRNIGYRNKYKQLVVIKNKLKEELKQAKQQMTYWNERMSAITKEKSVVMNDNREKNILNNLLLEQLCKQKNTLSKIITDEYSLLKSDVNYSYDDIDGILRRILKKEGE